jgi:hypothetical protein
MGARRGIGVLCPCRVYLLVVRGGLLEFVRALLLRRPYTFAFSKRVRDEGKYEACTKTNANIAESLLRGPYSSCVTAASTCATLHALDFSNPPKVKLCTQRARGNITATFGQAQQRKAWKRGGGTCAQTELPTGKLRSNQGVPMTSDGDAHVQDKEGAKKETGTELDN